jgi:hypothetical protein
MPAGKGGRDRFLGVKIHHGMTSNHAQILAHRQARNRTASRMKTGSNQVVKSIAKYATISAGQKGTHDGIATVFGEVG